MDEKKRKTFLHYIYLAWLSVAAIDYTDSSIIYLFNYLRVKVSSIDANMLRLITRKVLFPITATASILYAFFAWLNAHYDREQGKMKQEHLMRAIYNTFTAVSSVTAMVLGIVFGASANSFMFLLYGCNLIFGTIYNALTFSFHRIKAYLLKEAIRKNGATQENMAALKSFEEEMSKRKSKSVGPLILGMTNAAMAIAGFVAGKLGIIEFTLLGIVAGVIGIAFVAYEINQSIKLKKSQDLAEAKAEKLKTSSDIVLQKKMAQVAVGRAVSAKQIVEVERKMLSGKTCHAGFGRHPFLHRKELKVEVRHDGGMTLPKPA